MSKSNSPASGAEKISSTFSSSLGKIVPNPEPGRMVTNVGRSRNPKSYFNRFSKFRATFAFTCGSMVLFVMDIVRHTDSYIVHGPKLTFLSETSKLYPVIIPYT